MNNEVYAAIAMALHDDLGYNLHDSEAVKPVAAKPAEGADEMQDALRSPLPGTVIEIPVKTGM